VTDLTSSVALSNYQFGRVFSGSQFDQTLGPSAFDQPHRVLINATVTAPWKRFPTNVTTYASRQSGTPFTYTYFAGTGGANRGDLNVDGTNANDPIYIPRDLTDPLQPFVAATLSNTRTRPRSRRRRSTRSSRARTACARSAGGSCPATRAATPPSTRGT
jgi:hypothetical protein